VSISVPPLTEQELYALFDVTQGLQEERLEAALPSVISQVWCARCGRPRERMFIHRVRLLDFKTYLVLRGHHETALRLQTVEAMLALENL
jgi:uncharacterized protein (DUF2267 family)